MAKASSPKVRQIPLALIDRAEGRVRLEIDPERINELAQSIQERGLLQPIILRENGERFEIVAGERRFLAFKQLGLVKIWAAVRKMSDKDVALDRATENLQRADLSPVEEGGIYSDLIETHKLTAEEVGQRMGKSVGFVIRRIHVLKMPVCLQKGLHSRAFGMAVAEQLIRIKDIAALEYHVEMAVEHGIKLKVAVDWANNWLKEQRLKESSAGAGRPPSPVFDDKPHYVTCDTCHGAMELGKEIVFRVCPGCGEAFKKATSE